MSVLPTPLQQPCTGLFACTDTMWSCFAQHVGDFHYMIDYLYSRTREVIAMTGTSSQSWRLAEAVDTYSSSFFSFSLLFFLVCVAPAGLHFTYPKDKKAASQAAELPVEAHLQHSLSGADSDSGDRGHLSAAEPSSRGAVRDSASSNRPLLRKTDSADGFSLEKQQEVVCRLAPICALALHLLPMTSRAVCSEWRSGLGQDVPNRHPASAGKPVNCYCFCYW